MSNREIRVGIDVGGTHTKAVAIDNATHEIVGQSVVMTTHDDKMGVAAGVIECFRNCLTQNNISPDDVIFIAHSTTQATNALLEGDVAKVGIVGIGKGGLEGLLTKKQTAIDNIDLGTGKFIEIEPTYLKIKDMSEENVRAAVKGLADKGAKVIVASKAFGVDDVTEEQQIAEEAERQDIPCTVASDITKLYGLTTRTRTAAINASILPKMLDTANSTERSVRSTGVNVPLMIMRGDGGVMEVGEMKKRPILTMLSGPAASVVGALMYLRASNGIYFEVGGTSTNIGVIKNGRPAVDYSIIGGHQTYVNSLDVRVLGVAGGSMVRARKGGIVDVGPRSAHIAHMEYSCYHDPKLFEGAKLYYIRPRENDPDDYIAIKLNNGESTTVTNTCAAVVLKILKPGDYALVNAKYDAAYAGMKLLADEVGMSVEDTARAILQKSCEKIVPVVEDLIEKYKLERDQVTLVGAGGGAGTLLTFTADLMHLKYQIPENAEIISSIGVALAMIRDVVERVIPSPTQSDIAAIKKEAARLAIKSGAVPDSVEVQIEIDAQSSKVRAIALGSTEVKTTDLLKSCSPEELKEIAAKSMGLPESDVSLLTSSDLFYIFAGTKDGKQQIRLLDKKGFVKIQRGDGDAVKCKAADWEAQTEQMWKKMLTYRAEMERTPDLYLCIGGKVLDYANTLSLEQLKVIMSTEFMDAEPEEEVLIIGAKTEL